MGEPPLDWLADIVALVFEVSLFGVLTTIGVFGERAGLEAVTSGHIIGLWYVYVGTLALYTGVYRIGYRRLFPAVVG